MKHVLSSILPALGGFGRNRKEEKHESVQQAQGAPMAQLSLSSLHHIVGGDTDTTNGPHNSWGVNPTTTQS